MIRLPKDRRWKSDYSSDVFGSFVAGQNLDFDKEGYLTLAPKPVAVFNQDDDSNFNRAAAMAYLDAVSGSDVYVVATRDHAFQFTLNDGFTGSEIADSPSFASSFPDVVIFGGSAVFSKSTAVDSWDGSSWTSDRVTSLTAAVPHPMCVFENRVELAVGDGNLVKTYNTSYLIQNTLTLPAQFRVISLRWSENKLFIGTRNIHGGEAMIFVWNGSGTSAQAGYGVRAPRVYSLCNYMGGIVAVVSTGQVLRWTGGGFSPLKDAYGVEANFPVWYESKLWQDDDAGTSAIGKVYDRGTVADGDLIYFNVSSSVASNEGNMLIPNFPSGIWVFDPKVGLYHKALPTADKVQTIAPSSVASNIFTFGSPLQAQTGEPVFIDNVGSLTGLTVNNTYFAIKVSTTTFKLAHSQADAYDGTAITIGGSVGSASFVFPKNNQIGNVQDSEAGPICLVSPADLTDTFYNSNIIWASRVFKTTDVDATYDSLNMLSQAFNIGYLITPKLYSSNIKETWQTLYTKLRDLNFDTDSIVVKYRTRETFGLPTAPAAGTYSNDSTIGSNSDFFGQVEEGHEVVITKGIGAGRSAHVLHINGNEIELDEAIPNASTTNELEFYVTDFKRLSQPITSNVETVLDCFAEQTIGVSSAWVQFKIELRGARPSIEELSIVSEVDKPAV